MTDIVEFLTARLDEDEAVAGSCLSSGEKSGSWSAYLEGGEDGWAFEAKGGGLGAIVGDESLANHIARHDPARVLAEVKAKRRVLVRHRPATGEEPGWFAYAGACLGCSREGEFADPRTRDINDCPELRDMALADSDHPDYKERWRVS